jgi:hypothetical protein
VPQASVSEQASQAARSRAEAAARTKRVESYRAWTQTQREGSAAASGRNLKLDVSVREELAEAAESEQEKATITGLFHANRASALLASGNANATEAVAIAFKAAALLRVATIKHIKSVEKTTIAESKKDPIANQGKWIDVSGTIVQIRRDGDVFHGLLMTPGLKPISFATAGATKGIVEDSQVTFVGLLVSEYNFPNVSGGETQSLMLAGHFTGQGQDK